MGERSRVVCDRRGCHYGDHLQDLILREAGRDERIKFLVAQVSTFLNQRLGKCGKYSKSPVRGNAPLTAKLISKKTDRAMLLMLFGRVTIASPHATRPQLPAADQNWDRSPR